MEHFYHPEDPNARDPKQQRQSRLEDLRRHSDQYSRAAREALERSRAQGDTRQQLENLRNASGQ